MSGSRRRRAAKLASVAALLALCAASAAFAAPGSSQSAGRLHVQAQKLDTRTHLALLDLYALDSRLQAARTSLASLQASATALRQQRAELKQELSATRETLRVSRHDLALRLRALYEQGNVDPLAVVLGATSLGKGVRRLDDLREVADENRQVAAATGAARQRLLHARTTLAADARRLARSLDGARATERSLAAAATARTAYVSSLRSQAQLKRSQLDSLLATAKTGVRKSQPLQSPTPGPPAPSGGRKMVVSATCYILPGRTATGLPVGWGVVAVDPSVIPLGTRLYIPGYGRGVAADVGGGIKGAIIDLWFPSYAQCAAWGRRTVTITVY